MCHFIKDASLWLWGWLIYVLPALSNFILVLLGVLLSLPTLAEKIEKTPKYRIALGIICVIAGTVGFLFDVGQRRSSDQTNRQLLRDTGIALRKTNELIDKTTGLVSSTNEMVSRLGSATDHLANIDKNLDLAQRQNKPTLVAALRAEKKTFLITTAQSIAGSLFSLGERWYAEDDSALTQYHAELLRTPNNDEKNRLDANLKQRREDIAGKFMAAIRPVMETGNNVRQELIKELPNPPGMTDADKNEAVIFTQVSLVLHPKNISDASTYLRKLAERVSANSHQ
jgi:hypothetical protein